MWGKIEPPRRFGAYRVIHKIMERGFSATGSFPTRRNTTAISTLLNPCESQQYAGFDKTFPPAHLSLQVSLEVIS
jgi:hypothetical protein